VTSCPSGATRVTVASLVDVAFEDDRMTLLGEGEHWPPAALVGAVSGLVQRDRDDGRDLVEVACVVHRAHSAGRFRRASGPRKLGVMGEAFLGGLVGEGAWLAAVVRATHHSKHRARSGVTRRP
jgi:hypothetical protein